VRAAHAPLRVLTRNCGSRIARGDQYDAERDTEQASREPHGQVVSDPHAQDRAEQDRADEPEVDVAAHDVRDPGRPHRIAA
jgi:hypothetical protein